MKCRWLTRSDSNHGLSGGFLWIMSAFKTSSFRGPTPLHLPVALLPLGGQPNQPLLKMTFTLQAVEKLWHIQDSHDQIMALALRQKCLKPAQLFPLRSQAAARSVSQREDPRVPACPLCERHIQAETEAETEMETETRI